MKRIWNRTSTTAQVDRVYLRQKNEIEKLNRDHMVNGLVNHAREFALYS